MQCHRPKKYQHHVSPTNACYQIQQLSIHTCLLTHVPTFQPHRLSRTSDAHIPYLSNKTASASMLALLIASVIVFMLCRSPTTCYPIFHIRVLLVNCVFATMDTCRLLCSTHRLMRHLEAQCNRNQTCKHKYQPDAINSITRQRKSK